MLIDAPIDALSKIVDVPVAEAILKVRNGTAKVTPGYDGVYGQLVLGVDAPVVKPKLAFRGVKQMNIGDFW